MVPSGTRSYKVPGTTSRAVAAAMYKGGDTPARLEAGAVIVLC